jgi:undecaprenyl-diphosphatase
MLEKILTIDKQILIFLNGLGSIQYDNFWLIVTKQANWTPFFLLLLYIVFKNIGWKQTLVLVVFVAILLTFTDQVTNGFKYYFERLRPVNDPEINQLLRIVKESKSFSFFSGHAANSMAAAMFLYQLLHKNYRYFGLIFIWPVFFSYSRIYLGLHFPTDLLVGYFFGASFGFGFYKLYQLTLTKYFKFN